jgi:hypothetical protein
VGTARFETRHRLIFCVIFCVFFDALFDEELSITTSRVDPARAVHWSIPMLRAQRHDVRPGDTVSLDLGWTDLAVPATWR